MARNMAVASFSRTQPSQSLLVVEPRVTSGSGGARFLGTACLSGSGAQQLRSQVTQMFGIDSVQLPLIEDLSGKLRVNLGDTQGLGLQQGERGVIVDFAGNSACRQKD